MPQFDVAIIGAGAVGAQIAKELRAAKKNVALISLPGRPETYFERLLRSLAFGPAGARPAEENHPAGVKFFSGACQFGSKNTLLVGREAITSRRFVVASGAVPHLPPIDGLDKSGFKLPLNVLETPPRSAVIIGAGPVGVATAFALASHGCRVTLLAEKAGPLPKSEPEVAVRLGLDLQNAGVVVKTSARPVHVGRGKDGEALVMYDVAGRKHEESADDVVIAAGLRPNTGDLHLSKAGVFIDESGRVVTNEEMRTSAPHVWAAGEVTGAPFLLALHRQQAALVAANIFSPFFLKRRLESDPLPATLSLQPPLASIGLTEAEAARKYSDVIAVHQASEDSGTLVKIVGRRRGGVLLGASVLGPEAAASILFFDLVMRAGISIHDLLDVHHYPALTSAETVLGTVEAWSRQVSKAR